MKFQESMFSRYRNNAIIGFITGSLIRGLAPLLLFVHLSGCYSSVAVDGEPVKDLVAAGDKRVINKVRGVTDKEIISKMSQVEENDVFTEKTGYAEFKVGPLDVLEISSRTGEKVLKADVTVNNRGKISYSFIDDLEVQGMTASEIDDLMTKKLSSYVRNPRIDVLVKEFKSKTVLITGEFSRLRAGTGIRTESGRLYLKGKTRLMDLIAEMGGYTEDADIKNTRITRKGKTYLINLYDIIEKGDDAQNIIIDGGDVIDMPELFLYGERVYVLGEVQRQGVYDLRHVKDLLGAVALAGSTTGLAKEQNTLIIRDAEQGNKPNIMMANLREILREGDISQNIPLEDGDLVYVPRQKIGDLNDWIANTWPLLQLLLWPAEFDRRYFEPPLLRIQTD